MTGAGFAQKQSRRSALLSRLRNTSKRSLTSAVDGLLAIPPSAFVLENGARLVCRRFPGSRLSAILMWQVSLALVRNGDTAVRVATLPGGGRLALTLDEYSWRKLYFQLDPSMHRWLYERETTLFFRRWLRSGDRVIDVGANVGYFTMLAAQMVGDEGAVHAFEPNPRVVSLLHKSVALNGFRRRVRVTDKAVSVQTGSLSFFSPTDPGNTYEATVVKRDDIPLCSLEVASVSLDDYAVSNAVERVRLLKIDVEGAEVEVLYGAQQLLRKSRPEAVICEFAPRSDAEEEWCALIAVFAAFDYEPYRLDESGKPIGPNRGVPDWQWGNICFLPTGEMVGEPLDSTSQLLRQGDALKL